MKWGRAVNLRRGLGHNIPADLHMEHLNQTVKDYVANVGANVDDLQSCSVAKWYHECVRCF